MRHSTFTIPRLFILGCIAILRVLAAEVGNADLERRFAQNVRPLLSSYCIACHGGASPAAQFDLQPYSTVAAVTRDYPRWNLVLEKLTAKQMPPAPAKQPPAGARQEVIEWIEAMRAGE